jgi:hypothetical protein
VINALTGSQGLLREVAAVARRTGSESAARIVAADVADYQARTARIAALQNSGRIVAATQLAASPAATALTDRIDGTLVAQIGAAQHRFRNAAADATGSLSSLSIAIPIVAALVAGLALFGLRARLEEYR